MKKIGRIKFVEKISKYKDGRSSTYDEYFFL